MRWFWRIKVELHTVGPLTSMALLWGCRNWAAECFRDGGKMSVGVTKPLLVWTGPWQEAGECAAGIAAWLVGSVTRLAGGTFACAATQSFVATVFSRQRELGLYW